MNLNKKISALNFLYLAFIILMSTTILISAEGTLQDNENSLVNEMTFKLTKKLLLTKSQGIEVKKILDEYFLGLQNLSVNGSNEEVLIRIADAKIKNLLDRKQKMKYEIISNGWWDLANK